MIIGFDFLKELLSSQVACPKYFTPGKQMLQLFCSLEWNYIFLFTVFQVSIICYPSEILTFKAQNSPVEIISSQVKQVSTCGWSNLPKPLCLIGSLPDIILSVFIEGNFKVISCLCLWIIRWSSVGKRCQTNRKKGRIEGICSAMSSIFTIREGNNDIYINRTSKTVHYKNVKAWVHSIILLEQVLWNVPFELCPHICIIISAKVY